MSWVQKFSLSRVDQTTAYITTSTGNRDMIRFATGARREQLARLLGPMLGRPVRVEVDSERAPVGAPQADAGGGAPSETPERTPAAGREHQASRKEAMALPWVRQVMEVFEATVIDARRDRKPDGEEAATGTADDKGS